MKTMRLPKKSSNYCLIITILALSIIGGGAWCLFSKYSSVKQEIVHTIVEKTVDKATNKVNEKLKEKVIDRIFK